MSLRRAKQIIYGAFYILVLAGVMAGIYYAFVRPKPSCFDGTQNQGEEGVDCGGPCSRVCTQNIKPITLVDQVSVFRQDQSRLSFLARVNNPNLDYAARNFDYKFSLYNEGDVAIESFSGKSFIYAGEIKYILLPNVSVSKSNFSRADFSVDNPDWAPANKFSGPPQLTIQGAQTNSSPAGLTVDGRVVSADTVTFLKITVVAIFKGQLGQFVGSSQTEVESLPPNESRPFSVIHPSLANVDALGTKVFVYAKRP